MRTEILIFDWDGTLVDSAGEIVAAMQGAIAELELPARSAREMSRLIGLGLEEAFERLFPGMAAEALAAVTDRYRALYGGTPRVYGQPFPGVEQVLDDLAAVPLAVATGKSRRGLDRALSHIGWQERFTVTRCADETASKPDPRMLEEILLSQAVEAERALMIGDTTYDMEMARRAGVPAVGIAWGVHEVEELRAAGAIAVIDRLHDLPELLSEL